MKKRFSLLLTTVLTLLGTGRAAADDTNKLYFSFMPEQEATYTFDITTNTTHGSNSLSDDGVLTLPGTADFYGSGNAAAWTFTNGVAVDSYDRLIIRLKNDGYTVDGITGKSRLEVTVSGTNEEGSTSASLMHEMASSTEIATCKFTMAELKEKGIINIKSIKLASGLYDNEYEVEVTDADGNKEKVKKYYPCGNIVTLDEAYFTSDTRTADIDPLEIAYEQGTATGDVTFSDRVLTFANSGDANYYSWDLTDASNYKYLVVVPAKPFDEKVDKQMLYGISDGTNKASDWGFAWGTYQQHRISVYNMQDNVIYDHSDEAYGGNNYFCNNVKTNNLGTPTSFYIRSDNPGSYEISAVYLTNIKPTYDNRFNFAVDVYGVPSYDHHRETTAAGTWGTVCLPYDAAVCGANVYTVVGRDADCKTLYLDRHYGLLEAGTAYVFKSNSTGTGTDAWVTFYRASSTTAEAKTGGALVGNVDQEKMTVNSASGAAYYNYILQNGKWWKTPTSGDDCYIAQYRAYLDLSKVSVLSTSQAAKYIKFDMADSNGTTGIDGVDGQSETGAACYSLSGVRTNTPVKGLYIKNGKKVIIK